MDRLIALYRAWGRGDRRALPATLGGRFRLLLGVALLAVVVAGLLKDLEYQRSVKGLIPSDDIFAYECYSRAFWRGEQALVDAPHTVLCADHRWKFWITPPRAIYTLPREYPAPAIFVFSLPLLIPWAPFALAYMALMGLLTLGVVAWMAHRRLLLCGAAFALYALVGGWATLLARFDLVPGVLVLATLVLAERGRWTPAYLVLAVATLLKLYPVLALPILLIAQWRYTGVRPWRGLGVSALALAAGLVPFALLNPAAFLAPFTYNGLRPPQIESLAGSLLWLSGEVGGNVRVILTYHSVNVVGMFADVAAWLASALLIVGTLLVYWRAWVGRDDLGRSLVLVLLVTLCGSKLLSPQYLLWIFPTVAYVEGLRLRWLLVAALTVLIYPYGYSLDNSLVHLPNHPLFMGAILARNGALLFLAVLYLQPRQLLANAGRDRARAPAQERARARMWPAAAGRSHSDGAYERASR